jgi:oxidase EvaA
MNREYMQDNMRLVRSLLTNKGPAGTIDDIRQWLKKRNESVQVDIELTDFSDLKGWRFNETSGDLEHESGKFFAIRGLDVETEGVARTSHWNQPIIDQPEVGFLGIIAQEQDGVLCFLLQAKIEPGNLNHVQLSPTLQATRSNYMQVHKGKIPRYLEYFKNAKDHKIWLDQLQSEQGGRFFHKRNRNIIIEVKDPIPEHEDFIWVTLGQLKKLMHFDNLVNMDTRTIISGLGWRGNDIIPLLHYADSKRSRAFLSSLYSKDIDTCNMDNLFWLSELKTKYSLRSRLIPLKDLDHWTVCSNEIVHDDRLFFRVVGANITISNREVATWCQPLVQPMQEGICALIMKEINGVMHFLIQAKMECGTLDVVEMAPTLQCLTGNYKQGRPMFLEYILHAAPNQIVYDCYQSEEGGRFYREQNRNMLILAGEDFPSENPENFRWMSLLQLREFLKYNNYLNIQLRSLLAAINIFAD